MIQEREAQAAYTAIAKEWMPYVEDRYFESTLRLLRALYGEPERAYHNMEHVQACLELAEEDVPLSRPEERIAVRLALLWHDAVYAPGDKRNEQLSASLLAALKPILTVSDKVIGLACSAILATQYHDECSYETVSGVVVDIDLSILGSEPALYDKYVKAVRQEYARVSDDAWRSGRGIFLAGMGARTNVFTTAWGRERFETRARQNMRRELETLEAR